jgi:hypothetical protein
MFLDSSMIMKHNNCAVNIDRFHLKIDFKLLVNLVACVTTSNTQQVA